MDFSDAMIFTLVKELLGSGHVSLRPKSNGVYRFEMGDLAQLATVVTYFNQFPLRSVKSLSFTK